MNMNHPHQQYDTNIHYLIEVYGSLTPSQSRCKDSITRTRVKLVSGLLCGCRFSPSPSVPYIALQFVSASLAVSHLLPACVLERIFLFFFWS